MKVYQSYRNADMTEGRGPMVPDLLFLHEVDAIKYIDSQKGIMGRTAIWSKEKYGDWQVKEVNVITDINDIKNQIARDKALAKLSEEDKILLGLK